MNTKKIYTVIKRLGVISLFGILLSACNTFTRLSELGHGPKNSEIVNPTKRPNYRPVSMPMPSTRKISYNSNSLWRPGARAFFRGQRAKEVGEGGSGSNETAECAAW